MKLWKFDFNNASSIREMDHRLLNNPEIFGIYSSSENWL